MVTQVSDPLFWVSPPKLFDDMKQRWILKLTAACGAAHDKIQRDTHSTQAIVTPIGCRQADVLDMLG